ncbi:uncharacterized protein MONOS_18143 [Monocercomonoides exilis]|uniref:uncharacterized protein n=1 Tax=Monocercomonoides exilis TaxID=2049356 RepID=UPI00355A53B7|nr:hypothetical protein MONOS_18143 [Monocercomonoides exilis]
MMNKRSASDHSEEEEEEGEEGESEEDFEEDMDYYEDYDMDNLDEYYQSELTEKFSIALNKEGNEETQKEVEMALFALCSINKRQKLKRKLFVNEMSEIIQYHQSHRNLTQLAYQSAWEFMMDRFNDNDNLKDAIADKLHFVSEAARELDELKKRVDWKRKKEENEKRRKESKEELILLRWLRTLKSFFFFFQLRNEEFVRIISSIVQVFQAAKDHHREIEELCVCIFEVVVRKRAVKTDDLLKSGTVDAVFEELHRPPLNDEIILNCLGFFLNLSKRLNEIADDEMEEAKRKEVKMELFEKMEENGSEDLIIGLCESQPSFRKLVFDVLSYYL